MSLRFRSALFAALLAAAAGAIFLAISVDHSVYAPGARALQQKLAATDDFSNPLLSSARFGHGVYLFVRKSYSIAAFAIVGALSAPIFPRRRRLVACTLAVAAFSTLIEIAQWIDYNGESALSRTFDIGCGALGGAIGALIWNFATRRSEKRS